MSRFSVREIVLVLAVVIVSMNWALDHRAQVLRQEEWQKRAAINKTPRSDVGIEASAGNLH